MRSSRGGGSGGGRRQEGPARSAPKKYPRYKVSVRARTLNVQKLKVNDKRGNPVEIAAVVVWRVKDTAQAVFDVDDFEHYVETQSESALRHLASSYAYDHGEENEITLRSNVDEVSQALKDELAERWPEPAWWSRRPGSPTWPTRRRSPRPCCAGSRPKPSSTPGRRSSTAR